MDEAVGDPPPERGFRARVLSFAVVATLIASGTQAAAAPRPPELAGRCLFDAATNDQSLDSHEISYRRGLTCGEAKDVLRRLRGAAKLIPTACRADRTIDGWTIHNLDRDSAPLSWTQYRRGDQIINYSRWESFEYATCVPPGGFVFDGQ